MAPMSAIGMLFGKSPFGPLVEHTGIVKSCVELIIPFFEAAIVNDKTQLEAIAKKVFDLEDKADDIKNELRDHLPRSIFMPVDRNNLLEILGLQDTMADTAQDITIAFTLREMRIPEQIVDDLRKYIDSSVKVCFMAAEVVIELNELINTSLVGPEADKTLALVSEINLMERENDKLGLALTKKIFALESEFSPVEIFLWSKIIVKIGDMADRAQTMANKIRLDLAK